MFCNSKPYIFDVGKWIGNWLSSQLLILVFQEYFWLAQILAMNAKSRTARTSTSLKDLILGTKDG